MIGFTGAISGAGAAAAAVQRLQRAAEGPLAIGVRVGVAQAEGIVRGKASGRPGPRVITGDFRRSITSVVEVAGPNVFASIGSNAPQAARLEFGFYGADSLGRVYAQPPYPWLQPAIPEVEAAIIAAVSRAFDGGL